MVNLTINNQKIAVPEGTTIMEAAKQVGVEVPHLCYMKDINEIGACRVCVVEMKGVDKLLTACNTAVEEDMELFTNSPRVRKARKANVELILSEHDCLCATCVRSGNCSLQMISNDLGILEIPYPGAIEENRWDKTFPLIRDASKCIKCMRCVQVCDKIQDLQIWDVAGSGSRSTVAVSGNGNIKDSHCSLCGQCITHCPVGALRERDDTEKFYDAVSDPNKVVIVQIAPAIRTAWAENLGLTKEEAELGKLVSALKKMGANYVFDTNFTADLTIMEEGSEFLHRFTHRNDYSWPMFTSCCPGWLRYVKSEYPDYVENLSTAKSPQQMFGAMAKTFIAQCLNVDPKNVYSVSIMPCTAKKWERSVDAVNDAGNGSDVDLVLTTREVARMIRAEHLDPKKLTSVAFDDVFGEGSGAAVIFGATGGVMEAALRSAYFLLTGKNPDPDAFQGVRGLDGWKEASVEIAGAKVRAAIVSGLGNTRKLMEAIKRGEVQYDFVEVMACPGGCAGGGGQPIAEGEELAGPRGEILYGLDKVNNLRFSHENPAVSKSYKEFLEKPLGEKSHHLLHTHLADWSLDPK